MAAEDKDLNRDPLTDEPGSHPIGTGVGAAGGAVAGAAAGAIGGPVGMAVGGVVGAIVGGLAGKAAAEAIDPTAEDAHWRENYQREPYYEQGRSYDDYAPAYRLGLAGRTKHEGDWDTAEPDLRSEWDSTRGSSSLSWDEARPASRAAWDRIDSMRAGTGMDDTARYSEGSYDATRGTLGTTHQNMGAAGMQNQDMGMSMGSQRMDDRGMSQEMGDMRQDSMRDMSMRDDSLRNDSSMDRGMGAGMAGGAALGAGMAGVRRDEPMRDVGMRDGGMRDTSMTSSTTYGSGSERDGSGTAGMVGEIQSAGNNSGDRDDVIDVLQDLAECSLDGEYGFRECAERVKREDLRSMFLQRADDCRRGAQELNEQIRALGGNTTDHGSAAGAVHRGWVSVKSAMSTYDDKAVLEEAERGEDNAMARYRKALKSPLPAGVKLVVVRQMQGVQRNHDQVKMLRDQLRGQA
jgi:uncharacterized protein (TIGR02284 family)